MNLLMSMGCEPYKIVSAIRVVVAQRLLRVLCNHCKVPIELSERQLQSMGVNGIGADSTFFRSQGCNHCNKTGYKGRMAVFEVLEMNPTLKEWKLKVNTEAEIKRDLVQGFGFQTLRASAYLKAAEGVTSLEEAISMTDKD
jgi:type IV pilus assembly protein PilB